MNPTLRAPLIGRRGGASSGSHCCLTAGSRVWVSVWNLIFRTADLKNTQIHLQLNQTLVVTIRSGRDVLNPELLKHPAPGGTGLFINRAAPRKTTNKLIRPEATRLPVTPAASQSKHTKARIRTAGAPRLTAGRRRTQRDRGVSENKHTNTTKQQKKPPFQCWASASSEAYLHVERNADEDVPTYGDDDSHEISLREETVNRQHQIRLCATCHAHRTVCNPPHTLQ